MCVANGLMLAMFASSRSHPFVVVLFSFLSADKKAAYFINDSLFMCVFISDQHM